ncbi:2-C-methyl-D-erythritol 2,4-cyclodiphosphate synthase [cyanobacterium TDX16]|nr:2-C-methyl-D-erythritol 2,4-cyclodiphosphate synthase [cyanobacterium TDX16]
MTTDLIIHRIGLGTDLHRLVPGGPLRLGGVDIPFEFQAAAHSDGDVVLHAVTDALLGAAGLPDIGERYPDSDPANKGADSRRFIAEVLGDLRRGGLVPVNLDIVIQAERPKLSAHKASIRDSVAQLLGLSPDRVAVKAKTNEGLDAIGRGEAVGCMAVVGLMSISC